MEEINEALIVLIILKVFTQSTFKDFQKKKKKKDLLEYFKKNIIHIPMFLFLRVDLYIYSPILHLPPLKIVPNLEKVI